MRMKRKKERKKKTENRNLKIVAVKSHIRDFKPTTRNLPTMFPRSTASDMILITLFHQQSREGEVEGNNNKKGGGRRKKSRNDKWGK